MASKPRVCKRCDNNFALYSTTPKGKATICHECASGDRSGKTFHQQAEAIERVKKFYDKSPPEHKGITSSKRVAESMALLSEQGLNTEEVFQSFESYEDSNGYEPII